MRDTQLCCIPRRAQQSAIGPDHRLGVTTRSPPQCNLMVTACVTTRLWPQCNHAVTALVSPHGHRNSVIALVSSHGLGLSVTTRSSPQCHHTVTVSVSPRQSPSQCHHTITASVSQQGHHRSVTTQSPALFVITQ